MSIQNGREIKNARIVRTTLGIEDHGILTCMIHLDYGGSGQGFGGWCLDEPVRDNEGNFKGRKGTAIGMQFIQGVIETLKVEDWENLIGTLCRVECDHSHVYRIGHFIEDKWFDPKFMQVTFGNAHSGSSYAFKPEEYPDLFGPILDSFPGPVEKVRAWLFEFRKKAFSGDTPGYRADVELAKYLIASGLDPEKLK